MNSIRIRLGFICLIFSLTIGWFANELFTSYNEYRSLNKQLITSISLSDLSKDLRPFKVNEKYLIKLKSFREIVNLKARKNAISDVIQSYNNGHNKTLKRRIAEMQHLESDFRKKKTKIVKFLEKRIQYFAYICAGLFLFSLLFIVVYVHKTMFKPLNKLYIKMLDFSNNRYTYHFTTPRPDEVGRLHATFNSLAQQVLRNMDDLKSLDIAKSDFLSIASHELRTPLTSIKGSLSLLKSGIAGKFEGKALKLMTIAETETDRLVRLINDILDLTKIEAKKLPLKKDWSSLKHLIQGTAESMGGLCQTAKVKIDINEIPAIEALMDRDRVQQVITNLLSNAIKYSPENESVKLHCDIDEDEQLVISVTDSGPGIDPQDQQLIFEKFRQATGPKNPLVKGTGLGLAIAKAIVEEHDGRIHVKSVPNEGCCFYFTLPKWRFNIDENDSSLGSPLSNDQGVA